MQDGRIVVAEDMRRGGAGRERATAGPFGVATRPIASPVVLVRVSNFELVTVSGPR